MNPIRQALQGDKSVLVDIETFGLDKGSPIHEISVLHAKKRKAVEIVPKPMGVKSLVAGVDPVRTPVDKREIQTWDGWQEALVDNSDSYAAKHKERYPHLQGKAQKPLRKVRYGDDVVKVRHIAGLSAKDALATTLDLIKNKTVWIANVPFEASRLGLMAEVTNQADRVIDQATYGGRNPFQSLLVSDPGVLEARIRAHRTGDWTGVYEAMKGVDYSAPGTKVFDVQDLVRATQSYGDKYSKLAGLGLDFSEVYQGTSLNVQARLLGLPKEAHTSVKDNILAQRVGLKMVDHIEALEGMIGRLHASTGAALNPTSEGEQSAVDWLYRMHSFKQRARESYLDQRLARAHIDIQQNRPHGVYTGESVYKTTKKHRTGRVPVRVGMPIITEMNSMDEVIEHLSSRPEYSRIDVSGRWKKMRDEAAASGDPSYYKQFENSSSAASDKILDEVMADKPNFKFGQSIKTPSTISGPRFDPRVGRLSGHEYLKRVGKRTGLGLGLLALSGIIGASSKISSSDDDYNTIEGMGEDNYAAYLRHGSTDFGSGWRSRVSMLLAGAVIGGGLGVNAELSSGPGKITAHTSISGTSTITRTKQHLKGVSILMMEEAFDGAYNSGWASSKAEAEKYGAKIFPVGPNYPIDDAIAAVNANTESNRVFILSHGNNGSALKFTGAGAQSHENIVASIGYLNNRLDQRFTVDLGACNSQYLLNFDELNVGEVNKNLHKLGSHEPNAWYSEASHPDNVRKFRASASHGVSIGIYPLTMNETQYGTGWTTTPASSYSDDMATAPSLLGKRLSFEQYSSSDGSFLELNQAYSNKVLGELNKPETISLNKYTTGNNADEVMGLMGKRMVASGQLGAGLGGFAAGLASLVRGLAGKRKGMTNAIKSAAAIPTTWASKGVAGLTSAKNYAGRTGAVILGAVNGTGKNFRNYAASTGKVIGGNISAGVGSVRAGLTKTKDIIGGKINQAQNWTYAKSVSTSDSIGRMKGQLISASSIAQTRRPTISMPRSPGALASASISSTVESTLSGPARVHVGTGKRLETTRFNRTSVSLNNPSIGRSGFTGQAANNSFGFGTRPTIGDLGIPSRTSVQRNYRAGKTAPPMGVASVVAGSGRRIETTRFGALPPKPTPIGFNGAINESLGSVSNLEPAANSVTSLKRSYKSGIGGTSRRHVRTPVTTAVESVQTVASPVAAPSRIYRSGTGGTSKRHVNPVSSSVPVQPSVTPGQSVSSSAPVQASTPTSNAKSTRNYSSPSGYKRTPVSNVVPIQAAVEAAPKPGPVSQAVTKAAKSKFGLGVAAAAIAAVGLGVMMFSGKGSEYNDQQGMSEQGVAASNRKHSTDFGSPYQGVWGSVSSQIAGSLANGGSTPNYVNGVPINQEVSDFRDQQMQTPLQKRIIEAEMTKQSLKSMNRLYFLDPALTTAVASSDYGLSGHKDLQHISLSQVDWSVEDADTIIMKQGARGLMGQEMQIRLAGIDAPEVQHSDESIEMLRYKQGQPHGEAARDRLKEILTNAKNVEVVSDPSQATYGRGLGVLFADGENVNLQLIREGHVAALPFGERSADLLNRDAAMNAERGAYQGHRGMWQNEYWRTYRNSVSEQSRVTFNTLTRVDKLAGNMNLAGLEATMSMAQEQGPNKLTYMAQNALRPKLANLGKKREFKDNTYTVDYHTQAKHLDQLKFETKRQMHTYGNQLAEDKMSSNTHHIVNQSIVGDSMSPSTSIYNDELPTIIDKYTRKAGKRKLQAESQRAANQFMHTKNRYGGE